MNIQLPDILTNAPLWWRAMEMALFLGVAYYLGFRMGRTGRSEIKENIPVGMNSNNTDYLLNDAIATELPTLKKGVTFSPKDRPEEAVRERIPPAATTGLTDDLTMIDGIGPKLAGILRANGITSYKELANTSSLVIRKILDREGPQFKVHDPTFWPRQAALAQAGHWDELRKLQTTLTK